MRPVADARQFMHFCRVKRIIAIVPLALGACGLGHGQCNIPASEKEIRDTLAINQLSQVFRSRNVSDRTPEDYFRENPDCCLVKPIEVSFWDWLTWDRYSLPKYNVQITAAYRRKGATFTYYQFGVGDSCGRVPDAFGEQELVQGNPAPDPCSVPDEDRRSTQGALVCDSSNALDGPAVSVPVAQARKMIRAKAAETPKP